MSPTTRPRTQASAVRAWIGCTIGTLLVTLLPAAAQPSVTGATVPVGTTRSDTIGAPGVGALAPQFTEHPRDVTTTAFVDASFTVAYNGRPLPSVSWQFSADGTNWSDVPGATTGSLLVRSPVVAHDGTRWRARLSTPGIAPVFSNAATLTVLKATPQIRLDGLTARFDSAAHHVRVTTVPAGLRVSIRYLRDGAAVAEPIEAGRYTVIVEANGTNHHGRVEATLVIEEELTAAD